MYKKIKIKYRIKLFYYRKLIELAIAKAEKYQACADDSKYMKWENFLCETVKKHFEIVRIITVV